MPTCWGCERLAVLVALALLTSCSAHPPASTSLPTSILLVTFPSLRPDVTGHFGREDSATSAYDRFALGSDWAGTAVVASSAPGVALRSLMTGTSPWQHQTLTQSAFDRPRDHSTLPSELRDLGFVSHALVPKSANLERYLLADGFDTIDHFDASPETRLHEILAHPSTKPMFIWAHLPEPDFPFAATAVPSSQLLPELRPRELLLYADPSIELSPSMLDRLRTLYEAEVSGADAMLGKILGAIKEQHRSQFVTVITAGVGFEFGEQSQVMFAQNLGRASLEVPLAIELSPALRETLTIDVGRSGDSSRPVAQNRLWATLIEIAGGKVPPRCAPSLLRETRGSTGLGIVSELYRRNGENLFSLLEKGVQLVLHHRYASPSPEFYRAQIEISISGWRGWARRLLTTEHREFLRQPPLSGQPDALELELYRWTEDGRSESIDDSLLGLSMARELRHKFLLFSEVERTPESENQWSKVASRTPYQADIR